MWVCVCVYAHTHTHCTDGVLGCEPRSRDFKENRRSTDMDTTGTGRTRAMHTFHVDTVMIIFLHVTNTKMMSRGERQLDCLKRQSKGATNEAPTCAVPMHTPQTNSLWQGVGKMSSACEMGCWRRVQGTTKTVIRRRKTNSIICKVLRLWSNSEVLISPSNSDVSAQLWKRIGWRKSCEKNILLRDPGRSSLNACVHMHAGTDVPTYRIAPTHTRRMHAGTDE